MGYLPSVLPSSPLHKSLLHLANLSLELLNLLPAVQRPAVVLPQAVPDGLARLLDLRRGLLNLLARLELGLQVHDFLLHAGVTAAGVGSRCCCSGGLAGAVVLVERRAEVVRERVRVVRGVLCWRRFGRGGLEVCGEGCGEVGEFLGAGVADARELLVDARLDLKFEGLGASAVGLRETRQWVFLRSVSRFVVVRSTSGFDWSESIKLWLKRTGLSLLDC